jgi:hypothetical protein
VRCDGSDEVTFGSVVPDLEVAAGSFTNAGPIVSAWQNGAWRLWKWSAGTWASVDPEASGAGPTPIVDAPRIEGYSSSSDAAHLNRLVYIRSSDGKAEDALSYFDIGTRLGFDYFGQAQPRALDLEITFAVLADSRVAFHMYSPSGQRPGSTGRLSIYDETVSDLGGFELEKPDALAGLSDGSIAVLSRGMVKAYDVHGAMTWELQLSVPVAAMAAVDFNSLAVVANGDIFCVTPNAGIVRLTASGQANLL